MDLRRGTNDKDDGRVVMDTKQKNSHMEFKILRSGAEEL